MRGKCLGSKYFEGRLSLCFVGKLELIEEVDRFIWVAGGKSSE